MAGTYYSIGVVTPIANIATALLDKYGAFADPANLNGYNELLKTAEYLIFTCAAINDKYIRIRWNSSTIEHQWGTGWAGGAATTITAAIDFGTVYTSISANTRIDLVLHPNTYFLTTEGGSRSGQRAVIIGELSNGEYGVAGASGPQIQYSVSTGVYNTTQSKECITQGFMSNLYTSTDKIYKQSIIMVEWPVCRLMVDDMGDPIVFLNVYNMAHNFLLNTIVKGTTFLMSCGGLAMSRVANFVSATAWMSEHEAVE